jgi:hypothetical protein
VQFSCSLIPARMLRFLIVSELPAQDLHGAPN